MANQITVLSPQGRLDAAHARPLDAELQDNIQQGRVYLLVDMRDARYISSHGMRVLLAAHKQAQTKGGAVKLCGLDQRLQEIFEIAGFDRVFEIFDTREQAEQSYTV